MSLASRPAYSSRQLVFSSRRTLSQLQLTSAGRVLLAPFERMQVHLLEMTVDDALDGPSERYFLLREPGLLQGVEVDRRAREED